MASCRPKAQGVIGCLPVFIGDNNLLSAVQVSICGVAMGAYLGLLGPYYLIHLALPPPPQLPPCEDTLDPGEGFAPLCWTLDKVP